MKTALVLGGGGARGSYEIGVWQALLELSIKPDIVTGTSVGALNAALVALDDFDNALELWRNINTAMVFSLELDESLPLDKKIFNVTSQFIRDYAAHGGTDATPLLELIRKYVPEEEIRKSDTECGFVIVDKRTLKPRELFLEDVKEGQLAEHLLASASLFPAIKSCTIDDTDYMDGGYYDNLPVALAATKGAERVIAVSLDAIGIVRQKDFSLVKDFLMIRCYWDLGPLLVFDKDTIRRNIRLGYLDTMKAMGAYDGIAYSFINGDIGAFMRRNKSLIDKLNRLYTLSDEKSNTLKDLTKLKFSSHYKHRYGVDMPNRVGAFFRLCMETAGEILELDCQKLYSVQRYNEILIDKLNEVELPFISEESGKIKVTKVVKMLSKKARVLFLATLVKQALSDDKKTDIFSAAMFMTDEILAAYYLALLD